MGALATRWEERSYRVRHTNPRNPAYWLERLFGSGSRTATGLLIGDTEALSVPAILGGIRMVAEDVGGLPAPICRPDPLRPKASIVVRDHPAWDLLNWQPNPEMTAIDFRGTLTGHAMLRGDGFAEIEWSQTMEPLGLWPLRPDKMRLIRAGWDEQVPGFAEGELAYMYTLPSKFAGRERAFHAWQILHLRGFGGDGIRGHSVVRLMREGIALSLAAEEHGARFYANDATPQMVLKHPLSLSEPAVEVLRDDWDKQHKGLSNAHRMAILDEGMSLEKIGMDLQDAEYGATRKFQVIESARALRIPVTKLQDLSAGVKANVEEQGIEYVGDILPWGIRWEQALRRCGVTAKPYYVKHTYQALLRADMTARANFYHTLRQDGVISAEMVLDLEDMPTEGLSDSAREPWVPLNMLPSSAFDANGMTYKDRVDAAATLVLRGWEPDETLKAFGLPPIKHSGLVPTAIQLDPALLPKPKAVT